jgi:hypothetical protein
VLDDCKDIGLNIIDLLVDKSVLFKKVIARTCLFISSRSTEKHLVSSQTTKIDRS